eukprot:TRINITY_DN5670_c0_g1_i2.p1 TRINITY_DN5670_c0_g1~~TRINITY_DN5670_c0_g1_i2.p1  ORF type:complete len:810 (-),score=306.02 TRINITY_DN5670_c0_g1_i2:86-2515(-)
MVMTEKRGMTLDRQSGVQLLGGLSSAAAARGSQIRKRIDEKTVGQLFSPIFIHNQKEKNASQRNLRDDSVGFATRRRSRSLSSRSTEEDVEDQLDKIQQKFTASVGNSSHFAPSLLSPSSSFSSSSSFTSESSFNSFENSSFSSTSSVPKGGSFAKGSQTLGKSALDKVRNMVAKANSDGYPRRNGGTGVVQPDPSFQWEITEEQRAEWQNAFRELNMGESITNMQAERMFFKEGELDEDEIGVICCLADVNGDGKLDEDEFAIAKLLLSAASKGYEIPTLLPPSLLPSSSEIFEEDHQKAIESTYGAAGSPRVEMGSPKMRKEVSSEKVLNRDRSFSLLAAFGDIADHPLLTRNLRSYSSAVSLRNLLENTENNRENFDKEGLKFSPEGCEPSKADLCFKKGENGERLILSGTIDGFIQCLASEQHISYGQEFTEILIVTHSHFTSSHNFLQRLIHQHVNAEPNEGDDEESKKTSLIYQFRIINFIRKWIEALKEDFQSREMQSTLKEFIDKLNSTKDTRYMQCATILQKSLTEERKKMPDVYPKPMKLKVSSSKGLNMADIPTQELARQMTIFDHKLFKSIKPSEFLKKGWETGEKSLAFANRMEIVAYWVASEIVQTAGSKNRSVVLTSFLKLSENLLELRNFYSLTAIYLALSLMAIDRLKKTWKGISSRYQAVWQKINDLLNPNRNFANFRRLWTTSDLPKIPAPTVFQKDLLFMEDGNNDVDKFGLINFDKLVMIGRCINQIRASQSASYQFESLPDIQVFLSKLKPLTSAEILAHSKICEPSREDPEKFDPRRRTTTITIQC